MTKEKTLVVLKPDAVQRSLMGEIISRFEHRGLKMTACKMVVANEEQVFSHYNKDDAWFIRKGEGVIKDMEEAGEKPEKEAIEYGKDIIRGLAKYMTAGPSLAMVFEGHRAVDVVLSMVGTTEPVSTDIGTIRGDFGIDSYALCALQDNRGLRNLVHASESVEEAEREIKLWFKEDEIIKYNHLLEKILYDVNLDGIME